jgi:hypothetical protein
MSAQPQKRSSRVPLRALRRSGWKGWVARAASVASTLMLVIAETVLPLPLPAERTSSSTRKMRTFSSGALGSVVMMRIETPAAGAETLKR